MRDDQKTLSRQLRTITRQLEQLEETLKRQEKSLAGIPELQTEVRRCRTVYAEDARQAHLLPALRARLGDGEQIAAHTAAAVAKAPLELDPFPHIVIDGFCQTTLAASWFVRCRRRLLFDPLAKLLRRIAPYLCWVD